MERVTDKLNGDVLLKALETAPDISIDEFVDKKHIVIAAKHRCGPLCKKQVPCYNKCSTQLNCFRQRVEVNTTFLEKTCGCRKDKFRKIEKTASQSRILDITSSAHNC